MMYVRFPLSLRQVEDLLSERGIDICHETVRYWWNRFGPLFAAEIRRRRVHRHWYSRWRWHLDEVFVRINGETHYLWRAVDHEGEVLEVFATKRRDRRAAIKLLKHAMKRYARPQSIVTDRLQSYRAAMNVIGNAAAQTCGRWLNNRAENSHQPFRRREGAMARFRDINGLCPVPRGRPGLPDQQCRRAGPAWYRARQEGLAVRRLRPWRSQSRVHVHPDRHGENERRRSSGLARRRARSHRRPFVPAPRRAPPLELEAGPGRRHTSRITHVPRCCPTSRAKSKLTAVLAGWVPIKESSGSFGKRAARGLRLIILPDFSCQL